MLFDLRGRGRRRTVKIVYITLALLMGGGLVLFGITLGRAAGRLARYTALVVAVGAVALSLASVGQHGELFYAA